MTGEPRTTPLVDGAKIVRDYLATLGTAEAVGMRSILDHGLREAEAAVPASSAGWDAEADFIRDTYMNGVAQGRREASAGLDGLRAAAQTILNLIDESADLGDDSMPLYDALDPDAWHPAIDALRAALATSTEEPRWCGIHQHYKWCQHNGGVLGKTGYEAPTSTEEPRA